MQGNSDGTWWELMIDQGWYDGLGEFSTALER
jgi:hypothetical protein